MSAHAERPTCCGRPMQSFGCRPCPALNARLRRYRCPVCLCLSTPGFVASRERRQGIAAGVVLDPDITAALPGPVTLEPRGYPVITLGITHPYANSGGWQYLARYVVMATTGEPLRRDEEVHHVNGNRLDCRRENLKIMLAEHHGRHHARYQLLYMLRDRVTGRWLPSEVPPYAEQCENEELQRKYDFYDDTNDPGDYEVSKWGDEFPGYDSAEVPF